MALKTYATREEVPADQVDGAIESKDGKFFVAEPDDTSGLTSAIESERTKREAAERLAKKAADELKKLQNKDKATTHGLTEEQLTTLREDATKEEREARLKAETELATEREATKLNTKKSQFNEMSATLKVLSDKQAKFFKLHADEFDLTDDGKLMVKGKPGIDPKKHMEALAKEEPGWILGTQATGGGAAGITAGGSTVAGPTAEEIMKNPQHALAAARAAGKTE